MINIFEYLDYRLLLKDLYESRKKDNTKFSYRYIGQKVGFKSAGFFSNIIKGKRNISNNLIFRFAELLEFNKKETEYFEVLVLYNQSKQHNRRKYYFEKLLSMRKTKVQELTDDQYLYFNKWYNVALRELLNYYPFRGDYNELANMLTPAITPAQARDSVALLLKLGLIEEKEDHTYRVTDAAITTGYKVPLLAIQNFQLATLDMAKEAIDRFPREERSISTLSLSVSEETYKIIEDKLSLFRREVSDLVESDRNVINRVYQFNFQIFPFSKKWDQKKI
ncbi:MAG: TIGR02147 family protein [Chitinispirillia bacterium]